MVTPQENIHRAIKNNLRPLSCTVDSGTLLTDDQANELYLKASLPRINYKELCEEYVVGKEYIDRLVKGEIRPYIANRYYRRHI